MTEGRGRVRAGRGRARAGVLIGALAALPSADGDAQWVEKPGEGWSSLAAYHHDTRKRFGPDGRVLALFADGRAVATSAYLTTAAGLARGLDVWVQLSFHRLRYEDVVGKRSRTGPGDARLWLRAAPLQWLGSGLPVAVRAGVKVPAGDFDVNAEIVPLGDGQTDWEIALEAGHSFWPRSAHVAGWIGHRWREENRESRKDFGNEWFYRLQAGVRAGRLGGALALEGSNGAAGVTEGVRVPNFQRDLVQLQPSLLVDVGPGTLEGGVRLSLAGRNLPAGTAIAIQYFSRWDLFR